MNDEQARQRPRITGLRAFLALLAAIAVCGGATASAAETFGQSDPESPVEPGGQTPSAGSVPDGKRVLGDGLTLGLAPGGAIELTWGPSCSMTDADYVVYEGNLGDYTSHAAQGGACTTGGASSSTFLPSGGDRYYLVVPTRDGVSEGSYGFDSAGNHRPSGPSPCFPQVLGSCGSSDSAGCGSLAQLVCDGACTEPFDDPFHCGACGNACGGEQCLHGQCDTLEAIDDTPWVRVNSVDNLIDVKANDTSSSAFPITAVTQPANGTVTISPDGNAVIYTPAPHYCNDAIESTPTDAFTYTLQGGPTATVWMEVACPYVLHQPDIVPGTLSWETADALCRAEVGTALAHAKCTGGPQVNGQYPSCPDYVYACLPGDSGATCGMRQALHMYRVARDAGIPAWVGARSYDGTFSDQGHWISGAHISPNNFYAAYSMSHLFAPEPAESALGELRYAVAPDPYGDCSCNDGPYGATPCVADHQCPDGVRCTILGNETEAACRNVGCYGAPHQYIDSCQSDADCPVGWVCEPGVGIIGNPDEADGYGPVILFEHRPQHRWPDAMLCDNPRLGFLDCSDDCNGCPAGQTCGGIETCTPVLGDAQELDYCFDDDDCAEGLFCSVSCNAGEGISCSTHDTSGALAANVCFLNSCD